MLRQFATLGRDLGWFVNEPPIAFPQSGAASREWSGISSGRSGIYFGDGVGGNAEGLLPVLRNSIRKEELFLDRLALGDGSESGKPGLQGPLPGEPGLKDAEEKALEREMDVRGMETDEKQLSNGELFGGVWEEAPSRLRSESERTSGLDFMGFSPAQGLALGGSRPRDRNAETFGRRARSSEWYQRQAQWLDTLFPNLAPEVKASKRPQSKWPAEARALAHSLLRAEKLNKIPGGIEIVQQTDSFDVRWKELTGARASWR